MLYSVFDELRFDRRRTLSPAVLLDDALALASRCADHLLTADDVAADCERIIVVTSGARSSSAAPLST